jgi:16S rRNA processing protein RimM
VDGRQLGHIREILRTGANDVYVVVGPLGELLIPAIGDVVESIDVEAGRVLIKPMPGLLPGDD